MSANEIANALHAGGVLELGATDEACRALGSWGIERVALGPESGPDGWVVYLLQPARLSGPQTGLNNNINVVPMVSMFGVSPVVIPTATVLHEDIPAPLESFRGHVFISVTTPAGGAVTPPVFVNFALLRIPGLGS